MVTCLCINNDNLRICSENSTCISTGYCYSSQQVVTRPKFEIIKSAGCLSNDENAVLHCKTRTQELNYTCCRDDYCNQVAYTTKIAVRSMISENKSEVNISLLVLSIILVVVTCSLILFSVYERKKKNKHKRICSFKPNSLLQSGQRTNELFKRKLCATDAIGQVNSKLHDELAFERTLKEGQFTNIYHAKRQGMDVFVKIYKGKEMREVWWNEINIYKIILIRHENILNFIAKSEFYDQQFASSNYLTLTEYHPLGNLEHFLQTNPKLSEQQIVRLMLTASSGLNHLHLEISNNQRKPAIVHRNINAKNFIVKQDLTCALANFNYAVKSTELDTLIDIDHYEKESSELFNSSRKIGQSKFVRIWKFKSTNESSNEMSQENCEMIKNYETNRIVCRPIVYCPPEYLNNTINLKSIVSLKSADVYSFSLVLWQISNYLYTNTYRMPYDFHQLTSEMSHELRHLLLEQKLTILDYSVDCTGKTVIQDASGCDQHKKSSKQPHSLNALTLTQKSELNDECNSSSKSKNFQLGLDERRQNCSPTTKHEIQRIIREASYTEPLARLSIRKIESDLKKLIQNSQDHCKSRNHI